MAIAKLSIDIEARLNNFESQLGRLSSQSKAAADKVESAFGNLNSIFKNVGSSMAAAFSVGAVAGFVQSLAAAQHVSDKLKNSLAYSAGSAAGAAVEMGYLRDVTSKLGLDFTSTAQAYAKFAAATKTSGVSAADTKTVFEGISAAATKMGLTADETGGALLALSQMASKGTVQAEELRGQLAERLPGSFAIAAKAIGVTTAELGKMLESGQVIASDFLPKFGRALKEEFAGSVTSLTQEINRLNSAWDIWKQTLSNSDGAGFSWITSGLNESAAAMRNLGKEAGITAKILSGIGGFGAGAMGVGKFDTVKAQEQAMRDLASVKGQRQSLEEQSGKYGSLPPITQRRLDDLKKQEAAIRDSINELAVQRGKESGFKAPDLAGEYAAQVAKQDERLKTYLNDTSSAPKAAKIAAAVDKENKAFEASVVGLQSTDARYVSALKAHNERVAEITRPEKGPKARQAAADPYTDVLTPAAQAYARTMENISKSIQGADESTMTLDASQKALYELMSQPQWEQMPEAWKKVAIAQAEAGSAAIKTKDDFKRLQALLAATPTAQLEVTRDTMLFLADAFKTSKINADQFSEAAQAALGTLPEQAKEATDAMTVFAEQAARNMQDAFADFLFDPFKDGTKNLLENFGTMLHKMAAQAASAQITSAIFGKAGGGEGKGLFGAGVDWFKGLFEANASGGVYNSHGLSAYSGTIVSSPTIFPFARGAGLMGEAGPEAILPLSKGADGKLGVQASGGGVVVNVINNASGTQATQQTRQDAGGKTIIDVMIETVKGAIARDIGSGGQVAGAMESQYGLNRAAGAWR